MTSLFGTELEEAAKWGKLDDVRTLLASGADASADDSSAMRAAINKNFAQVVKILLEAGANVHSKDEAALREAARLGHAETVEVLLAAEANVHVLNDIALRNATENGHTDVVEMLCKAGANVHADDDYALRKAVKNDNVAMARMLIQYGADVYADRGKILEKAKDENCAAMCAALRAAAEQDQRGRQEIEERKVMEVPIEIPPCVRLTNLFTTASPNGLPLAMFQSTWQKMAAIRDEMAARGEFITTDQLRAQSPEGRGAYLYIAIKHDALDQVLAIAKECSQPLTLADFTAPDRNGRTALDEIAQQKKLGQILNAEIWIGRAQEMAALWQKIPDTDEAKPALQNELSRASVLSMRRKMTECPRF